ncbi:hypothetical protein CLV78_104342 [Aliiruegeria haliotis]|uniref:Fructokinase n=1 Tax=Aliiruegeria haliotis TaxID=1280846 RepID=A0A2T0RRM4_9RHOB|nr:hypothetical protein [Aliiruegeria haliotis]PRY23849.1 hypothetical protein CLV78_104342 [Aliiruegeria haliotis]
MDTDGLADLVNRILTLPEAQPRLLIALAGPPASGKSTLGASLVEALNSLDAGAVLVPMDGFHLDNAVLVARDLLPRKGAPETFDGAGFVHAMRRLKSEKEVVLPTFDRHRDISIAGAIPIGPADRIAVVEGNYLCLAEAPWSELADIWDLSCFIDVPEDVLLERLVGRWLAHGLSAEDAETRARSNDLVNAARIKTGTGRVDVVL